MRLGSQMHDGIRLFAVYNDSDGRAIADVEPVKFIPRMIRDAC